MMVIQVYIPKKKITVTNIPSKIKNCVLGSFKTSEGRKNRKRHFSWSNTIHCNFESQLDIIDHYKNKYMVNRI